VGDYAEMMLDGTCCCSCGEFLGGGSGYAEYCFECKPDEPVRASNKVKLPKTIKCSHVSCARKFASDDAMRQHVHNFHTVRIAAATKAKKKQKPVHDDPFDDEEFRFDLQRIQDED